MEGGDAEQEGQQQMRGTWKENLEQFLSDFLQQPETFVAREAIRKCREEDVFLPDESLGRTARRAIAVIARIEQMRLGDSLANDDTLHWVARAIIGRGSGKELSYMHHINGNMHGTEPDTRNFLPRAAHLKFITGTGVSLEEMQDRLRGCDPFGERPLDVNVRELFPGGFAVTALGDSQLHVVFLLLWALREGKLEGDPPGWLAVQGSVFPVLVNAAGWDKMMLCRHPGYAAYQGAGAVRVYGLVGLDLETAQALFAQALEIVYKATGTPVEARYLRFPCPPSQMDDRTHDSATVTISAGYEVLVAAGVVVVDDQDGEGEIYTLRFEAVESGLTAGAGGTGTQLGSTTRVSLRLKCSGDLSRKALLAKVNDGSLLEDMQTVFGSAARPISMVQIAGGGYIEVDATSDGGPYFAIYVAADTEDGRGFYLDFFSTRADFAPNGKSVARESGIMYKVGGAPRDLLLVLGGTTFQHWQTQARPAAPPSQQRWGQAPSPFRSYAAAAGGSQGPQHQTPTRTEGMQRDALSEEQGQQLAKQTEMLQQIQETQREMQRKLLEQSAEWKEANGRTAEVVREEVQPVLQALTIQDTEAAAAEGRLKQVVVDQSDTLSRQMGTALGGIVQQLEAMSQESRSVARESRSFAQHWEQQRLLSQQQAPQQQAPQQQPSQPLPYSWQSGFTQPSWLAVSVAGGPGWCTSREPLRSAAVATCCMYTCMLIGWLVTLRPAWGWRAHSEDTCGRRGCITDQLTTDPLTPCIDASAPPPSGTSVFRPCYELICTAPSREADWRALVGGGGVGGAETEGWEEGVDVSLLTGREVQRALGTAQLPVEQTRVWDMSLWVGEEAPNLLVPFVRGISVTVLCGDGHYRVVLGV